MGGKLVLGFWTWSEKQFSKKMVIRGYILHICILGKPGQGFFFIKNVSFSATFVRRSRRWTWCSTLRPPLSRYTAIRPLSKGVYCSFDFENLPMSDLKKPPNIETAKSPFFANYISIFCFFLPYCLFFFLSFLPFWKASQFVLKSLRVREYETFTTLLFLKTLLHVFQIEIYIKNYKT